jgi:hypothetical protein
MSMALAPGCASAQTASYVPDEVIVRFRAGVDEAGAVAVAEALGLRVKKPLGQPGTYLLCITDGTPVPQAIERLRARPEVEVAEPNYLTPRPRVQRGPTESLIPPKSDK